MNNKRNIRHQPAHASGMTLLDVLLAIMIFVVGMLALAHLQTNLTRSATDASARTVAMSIGEEIIESLRSFQRLGTDPDGEVFAFADIDSSFVSGTYERGGLNYVVTGTVTGHNFADNNSALEEPVVAVAGDIYDFKRVQLTISWDNNPTFQVGEGATVEGADLGTGQVTLEGAVSSIPVKATAKIAKQDEPATGILVQYIPGERPDIIQLDLENNRFKESTTPMPDVIRSDELTETWFDVITYSGTDPFQFARREEFLVVSCVCEMNAPDGTEVTGFLPTIWNGNEYTTQGDWVSKNYGTSASNQQSAYCSTCCRDHHDPASPASTDQVYDPHREWTEADGSGAHTHYGRTDEGLVLAAPGDEYVETCRMVRKDGFMRVAQDFRQEGFIAFPEGYLETLSGASTYADYVEAAVKDFYERDRSELTGPDGIDEDGLAAMRASPFPARSAVDATTLPFNGNENLTTQQMRSRGIYVDTAGSELAQILNCMIRETPPSGDDPDVQTLGDLCGAPGANSYLELLPFFEVQTTWLSWWNENSNGDPMDMANEAVRDDNAHDRGIAELTNSETDPTQVIATTTMHRGNIGLSVTDPISPLETSAGTATADDALFVDVNGSDGTPLSPTGIYWSGSLQSGVGGVDASSVTITPDANTHCSRSGTAISCMSPTGNGSIRVAGYYKNARTSLWVCAVAAPDNYFTIVNNDPGGAAKSADISWSSTVNVSGVQLMIQSQSCGGP